MSLRKAQRQAVKLKIGVAGPSGSGKTKGALRLARGMASSWEKVAVIDTENGSADLYSDLGQYNVITLQEFKPSDYIKAIKDCEEAGMEVIVIDSMTHEWKYILEAVDKITQASSSKNSYTAWGKATPIHDQFIQAILKSPCHVICTVRTKQDYDMSKDSNGKTKVQKVGMKQEQREGFEYELTISFDVDMSHQATASKDRTGLFMGKEDIEHVLELNESVGQKIKDWNNNTK